MTIYTTIIIIIITTSPSQFYMILSMFIIIIKHHKYHPRSHVTVIPFLVFLLPVTVQCASPCLLSALRRP